jgi:glycosyltransferase involved in cell wall biosynthesis
LAAILSVSLVSVIIPAYNAERYIEQAIVSALDQTYPLVEVIVVNDRSTDKTASLVSNFGNGRVRLIEGAGGGAAAARNLGVRFSAGDYLQFLDADDLLSPKKVSLQVDALASNPSSIASCAWFHFQYDPVAAIKEQNCWRIEDPVAWLQASLSGGGMMQTACWLVPRAIAQLAGPWNESLSLHDDGEYFCRVLLSSQRQVFTEACHVAYRQVSSSLSRRRSQNAVRSAFEVCRLRSASLLARDESLGTRVALATQWGQFAYEFVSEDAVLSHEALQEIRRLNCAPANVLGGAGFRWLRRLAGWKAAFRLYERIRAGRSAEAD